MNRILPVALLFVARAAVAAPLAFAPLDPPTRATDGALVVGAAQCGPRSFACQLQPSHPNVVFAALGRPANRACRALFDPEADAALVADRGWFVFNGQRWELHADARAKVTRRDGVFKKGLGVPWFAPIDRSVHRTPPCGWCSWYYYSRRITQAEMVKNAQWMAKHLKPFGAAYVQLDDGWQGRSSDWKWWRDWGTLDPDFPNGMKWLADHIHADGMKAGLWLIPFSQSSDKVFNEHPDWFLRQKDGAPVHVGWVGKYLLDPTQPGALKHIEELFKWLTDECGYDYFKIDGEPSIVSYYRRYRPLFHDPKADPVEAYRNALRVIRGAIGPERFLLGCWGTALEGIGYFNGSRTGGDVAARWDGALIGLRAVLNGFYLHNVAWYSDPDVLCVRPPLTLDQARAWASLLGLTGQLLMASDKMYELPEDRVEVLRRVMPPADVRPMSLYKPKGQPQVWDLKVRVGDAQWDVVGAFNWRRRRGATVRVGLTDLGLPADRRYVAFGFWGNQLVGPVGKELVFALPRSSCRVWAIHEETGRPLVVSTSRHITQGGLELSELRWDAAKMTLSGASQLVAGDPYELRIYLPQAPARWRAVRASCAGAKCEVARGIALARVKLSSGRAVAAQWSVTFAKEPTQLLALGAPAGVQVKSISRHGVELAWRAAAGAAGYRVLRDGAIVGIVGIGGEPRFSDAALLPRQRCRYQVAAYDWAGKLSALSAAVEAQGPPAVSSYLDRLEPASVEQQYGTLQINRSVERKRLRIGKQEFSHGLGTHANSRIVFKLNKAYRRFTASCGVDAEKDGAGTVAFEVWLDGHKAFDSGRMTGKMEAKKVEVDLSGVDEMALAATDAGDGINCDHADWANAILHARPRPADVRGVFLSDLKPLSVKQGWRALQMDKSAAGNRISIGGMLFDKGLGTHAASEIVFALDGKYERFKAQAGVDDEENGRGSVVFEVWADDEKLWASGVVRGGGEPEACDVLVAGKKRLRLVVGDAGDNINSDHADWADARIE